MAILLKNPNTRILELDALRGIASLFVVFFHFNLRNSAPLYILKYGVTGVDLFFIISGFVILLTVERSKNTRQFLINRFSRLYPTYWACVTLTSLFLYCIGKQPTIMQYLANLTMFQVYFHQRDIDDPYWTMLVEMLFYIFIVFLLTIKKTKFIEQISMGLLILPLAYALFASSGYNMRISIFISKFLPLINHFPLFCAGMIFYRIKSESGSFRRYLYLILCFICQIFLFNTGGKSYLFVDQVGYALMVALYFFAFYGFVINRLKFIVNKVTLFFGQLSYSLYLIHQSIGLSVITYLLHYLTWWMSATIALILVLTLSFLVNRLIEIPAMRYIRSHF